jgi:hypothetical protein
MGREYGRIRPWRDSTRLASRSRTACAKLVDRTKCAVELTGIVTWSREWWTLGFEAAGPLATQRAALEAAAHPLFSVPVL